MVQEKSNKEIMMDAIVKEDLPKVREILSQQNGKEKAASRPVTVHLRGTGMGESIYGQVVTSLSNGTRNTPEQIKYLESYESALSVFRTAALELRKEMDILTLEQRLGAQLKSVDELRKERAQDMSETVDKKEAETTELQRKISDSIFFSNRYALYFAGQVGLGLLGSKTTETPKQFSFGTNYDSSKDKDDLTQKLNEVVLDDLRRITGELKQAGKEVNDDTLKYTLEAVFTTWANQFNWSTFKDVAEGFGVDKLKLRYGAFSMQDGKFSQKHSTVEVDDRFMRVKREDVIGNTEFGKVMWKNMVKLSAYDPERQSNPHDPASVIFTFGNPGCGKTFTSHAYIKSFAELCRSKGIPLWALTHSVTDYASHYQNKTANELASLAGKINAFPGVVILYVADADTIFGASRKSDLTMEQQNTMGVYFKMFDGTLIPKNGKFMAIMDANYIDGIDDATKSRLFDDIVELKRFDSAKDFADMARVSISKRAESLSLKDKDWMAIGEYILGTPLSNREIDHVLKRIRRDFEVPESMVGASYEEHAKYRSDQLKGINREKIISTFDGYIKTRAEIEESSRKAKVTDDVERFLSAIVQNGNGTKENSGAM